jgi:hypothetical protein
LAATGAVSKVADWNLLEHTPWHATQRAAWEALKNDEIEEG